MPVYITLITLTDHGRKIIKDDPARIKGNNRELEAMGVKVLAQYATLGQYDFINIFEAKDDETLFNVAVNHSGKGIAQSQTLTAMRIDDFIAATKTK
jgi:uncharacterized protein with GYD domain